MTVILGSTQVQPTTMTATLKPATNQQVRSKFFSMIGIESKVPPASSSQSHGNESAVGNSPTHVSCGPSLVVDPDWIHPRMQNVACTQEALKYDKLADQYYSLKRRKTTESTSENDPTKKPKKKINFNETVEVVPIPMRQEYSNRVRSRLWSNAIEIHQNAARNTIEFAAEGWDWRTVTEDERMYVCVATGELIHPCHYEPDFRPDA